MFFSLFLWKFVCYFFGLSDYVSCYMLKSIQFYIYPSYYSMYPQIPAFASVSKVPNNFILLKYTCKQSISSH